MTDKTCTSAAVSDGTIDADTAQQSATRWRGEHVRVLQVPADDIRMLPNASSYTARFYRVSPDQLDESPRQQGFQSALAILDDGTTRIGYVRITYMDANLIPGLLINGLLFANRCEGNRIGHDGEQALDPNADEKVIRDTYRTLMGGWCPQAATDPIATVRTALARLEREHRKHAAARHAYHRIPYVAYAHIDPAHRRTGLGTALYLYAADQLARDGQMLRGSGAQTPEAQALWTHLRATYADRITTVTVTDPYRNVPLTFPALTGSPAPI